MVNKEQLGVWKKIVFFCCELCSGNSVELWNKDLDKDTMVDEDIMEEKDFISGLPDDILVSIISRTHIKVAVRTSSLSKRWRNLYKLLSSVDFSCEYHAKHRRNSSIFADQMLRFLQLHSGDITYFNSNSCLTSSDAPIFERSIQILGNLSVKSASLNFAYFLPNPFDPFASNLFSFFSHLLSYMPCLQYCWLTACNLLPTLRTSCTSLQKLGLSSVKLFPGSVDCILSNCLSLRSLHFIVCKFEFEKMDICGDNLRLEYLQVIGPDGLKKIEFYASNLKTFEYLTQNYSAELIFDYVPQLQNVEFGTPDAHFGKKAMSYLCGLPHLKTLILDTPGDYYQEFILETELMIPGEGSEVEMQVVPHEHLKSVYFYGFMGTKTEVEFVVHILKSAMILEEMFISHHDWREYGPKLPKNMKKKRKNIVRQLKHYATVSQAQLIFRESPRRSNTLLDRPKVKFSGMYAPD